MTRRGHELEAETLEIVVSVAERVDSSSQPLQDPASTCRIESPRPSRASAPPAPPPQAPRVPRLRAKPRSP